MFIMTVKMYFHIIKDVSGNIAILCANSFIKIT